MSKVVSAIILGVFTLVSGCATNNSAKVRSKRPVTVGLSTSGFGGMYRPNDTFAFGAVTGGTMVENDSVTIYSSSSKRTLGYDEFNVLETQTGNTDLFFHYFPWHDSAFYMGIKLSKTDATFIYQVESEGSVIGLTEDSPEDLDTIPTRSENSKSNLRNSNSIAQVSLETSSTQIKIPFGWSWIWENGISFLLELGGPIVTFEQTSNFAMTGEYQGVDRMKRDLLATELKETVGKDSTVSMFLSFGYSF